MNNMTFADVPEDRQSDAKDVEAAIRSAAGDLRALCQHLPLLCEG